MTCPAIYKNRALGKNLDNNLNKTINDSKNEKNQRLTEIL